ncbi:MAG TPA: hypothetical protein VIE65_12280 [Methylobacter sp.]|jgi:hypothetical protein
MLENNSKEQIKPGAMEAAITKLNQAEQLIREARQLLSGQKNPDPEDIPILAVLQENKNRWMSESEVSAELGFTSTTEAISMTLMRLCRKGVISRMKKKKRKLSNGYGYTYSYKYPFNKSDAAQHFSEDPWVCEHPNEAPSSCPCKPDYYCKTRTCVRLT